MPEARTFTSKYPGWCRRCSQAISVGERIQWVRGEKTWHTACDPSVAEADRKAQAEKAVALEASRATDSDIEIPCPDGLAYLPYQKAGIAFALGRPSTLFGDEMGLGKTIEAVGVINADASLHRVLVICPASLRLNWERELTRWLTRALSIGIAGSDVPETDVVIINYDILRKHRTALLACEWDLAILDEAHYIKNSRAQRTKLAHEIAGGAGRKLLLTGTPVTNRPVELFSLLKLLDPETWDQGKKGGFFRFAIRYCAAYKNQWGWDFSGASHLDELQERLRSTVLIRRLKKDVLPELPPKRRQVIEIPANGAGGAVKAETAAWEHQEDALESLQADVELAKAQGEEQYKQAVQALQEGARAAFGAISRVRHDTAVAKIPAVIEHLESAIESGKVLCFFHHHDMGDAIGAHFGDVAVQLDGRTPQEARQAAVDRFQTDESSRLFVGSIGAAGVGLTLTASSHVVFAELDWVPANVTQAEDRAHRIGQKNHVLIQHLVLEGSLDARIAKTIVKKQDVIDQALDVIAKAEPVVPARKRAATSDTSRDKLAEIAETLLPEQIAAIHEGLRTLKSYCDGARNLDGAGFSKIDVRIGHELAVCSSLTPRQAALGQKLVNKYRRQLDLELVATAKGDAP